MCTKNYSYSFFLYFFIPTIHFTSDIDLTFGKDQNIDLYRELYHQIVNIDIGAVSNVVKQKDKEALNIFLPTEENLSLFNALSVDMLLSQKICLIALLGNPICKLDVLQTRQVLLQTLSNADLETIERLLYSFSKYETLFFSLLLQKQNFSLITDENIINMLNTINSFLEITNAFVALMPSFVNPNISFFFRGMNDFIRLYQNNEDFKKCVDSLKTTNKVKKFYFKRHTKIKHLQQFFYFSNVFLRVFVDIITIMVYKHIQQISNSFCFVSFLPRNESSDPYIEVAEMKNFYNNSTIDKSFSLTLKKIAPKTLMDINGVFVYDSTAKNLLLNIYLAQVFGVALAKKFSMSLFNKIYTSNLRR